MDPVASIDPPATARSALIPLLWLASPALPVGGYSYSEGLEAAVEHGLVGDEDQARDWLLDQLLLGLASGELPLVAAAIAAWRAGDAAEVEALNRWWLATRESAELRRQTEQMGRSMADWLRQREAPAASLATLAGLQPPTWPVAWALGAALGAATPEDALQAFAFGWAENAVQTALRAVPLGQNSGQRILGALAAQIPVAVAHALALPAAQRQAFLPGLAVLSARHESQYSRLFRS
jgi:urease accessory protein